jgi:hypothetical protein
MEVLGAPVMTLGRRSLSGWARKSAKRPKRSITIGIVTNLKIDAADHAAPFAGAAFFMCRQPREASSLGRVRSSELRQPGRHNVWAKRCADCLQSF